MLGQLRHILPGFKYVDFTINRFKFKSVDFEYWACQRMYVRIASET